MIIRKLQVDNLRNLSQLEIVAHPAVNTLYGANGAGKTSVLESIAVLSRGRSFRSPRIASLIGPNASQLRVFAEISAGSGSDDSPQQATATRLGLERGPRHWKARRNGQDLSQLSALAESLAVVVMEPNSHELISGAPEIRRRYIDWGVFHVEPAYLDAWHHYSRALRQRNAALRSAQAGVAASLEPVLAEAGERMSAMRRTYTDEVSTHVAALMEQLSPGLGRVTLDYRPGWKGGHLAETFREHRAKDLERGATQSGPHRADLSIKLEGYAVRDAVSRGEEKVLATALVFAQARRQRETGRAPVLLLDDLASEFDRRHFDAALRIGKSLGLQMWITGVEAIDPGEPHTRFHVEHGVVQTVV